MAAAVVAVVVAVAVVAVTCSCATVICKVRVVGTSGSCPAVLTGRCGVMTRTPPMTHTSGNQYFVGVDPDKAQVCCGRCNAQGTDHWSFSQYQNATGRGAGSSLSGAVPKPAAIAQKARAMLGLPSPA